MKLGYIISYVPKVDEAVAFYGAAFDKAIAAGASAAKPPTKQPWGKRSPTFGTPTDASSKSARQWVGERHE